MFIIVSFNLQAADRCPASSSGCNIDNGAEKIRERVNEGAQNVMQDTNPSGRLDEIKSTVKECLQCGTDAIKDGFNKASGSESNN